MGNPILFTNYQNDKRLFESANQFARESGRFDLTAKGKVNTYALFAEHFANLANRYGRAGVIVPTGIATDATTAEFFAAHIAKRKIVSLFDFENREKIFAAVDSRTKFCLLTIGSDIKEAAFAFFLTNVSQLGESERRFTLKPEDIARINPNTKTSPVFRSRKDAELTAKIYACVPVLIDETKGPGGNTWQIEFRQGLFNMTSDSGLFLTAEQLTAKGFSRVSTDWFDGEKTYVPLYEAKMIHQFDHRWATHDGEESRDCTLDEKRNVKFEPSPRYWVLDKEVEARLASKSQTHNWLLGWRDITNATNERTAIYAAIPRVGVGHNCPIAFSIEEPRKWAAFIGNLNSTILDFVARQSVGGTHLTYTYLKQLAILPAEIFDEGILSFITPRVLELTYTSHSMAPFVRDLGYEGPPFVWDEERRALLRAELDAFYGRAYGLTRDELRYILDPADVMGADYPSETFRVLKNNEIRKYGEYRTQRLVLDAWDRMASGEFGLLFQQTNMTVSPPVDHTTLTDGAWTPQPLSEDSIAAQLAAIIAKLPGSTPAAQVRLAALYALEPRHLTARIDGANRAQWLRLCGAAAQPLPSGTSTFAQPVNAVWGKAVTQLKGMRALVEDANAQTWSTGPAIANYGLGEDMPTTGRARFVLQAMAGMNIDQEIATLPAAERTWLAANAA